MGSQPATGVHEVTEHLLHCIDHNLPSLLSTSSLQMWITEPTTCSKSSLARKLRWSDSTKKTQNNNCTCKPHLDMDIFFARTAPPSFLILVPLELFPSARILKTQRRVRQLIQKSCKCKVMIPTQEHMRLLRVPLGQSDEEVQNLGCVRASVIVIP